MTVTAPVDNACGRSLGCEFEDDVLKMDVTFIVFLASLLSFVGWFLFVVYAGIGLVAIPLDLIK